MKQKLNTDLSFDLVLSRDGLHSSGGIDIYNFKVKNSNPELNKKTSLSLSGTDLGADIRKGDLDGDGRIEFVVSNSASEDWKGHNLYVVSTKGRNGKYQGFFMKVNCMAILVRKTKVGGKIFLIDIDGNSNTDYACSNRTHSNDLIRPPVIISKDDKYYPLELQNSRIRQFVPFKIPSGNMLIGTRNGKAGANDVMLGVAISWI